MPLKASALYTGGGIPAQAPRLANRPARTSTRLIIFSLPILLGAGDRALRAGRCRPRGTALAVGAFHRTGPDAVHVGAAARGATAATAASTALGHGHHHAARHHRAELQA